ncbi:hypothetical protein [uncultured Jannaschia sp.]|uniref:hypothetical protein n=1 Tax=uncultured Jannaschia sp. TaxID=293347 RepID=UPI0026310047|nr:hypothetical protein [uncultured Jannaschia sp.]
MVVDFGVLSVVLKDQALDAIKCSDLQSGQTKSNCTVSQILRSSHETMSSIKGQCSNCGWTTKRHLKNMKRPCPKCGGNVYVHEEDRQTAIIIAVLSIAIMIGFGVLMIVLEQ